MPRKKTRRLWVDYLAYLAVRCVVAFAQMLSIEQSYALARFLGWVIYRVDKRHRQVGIDNLTEAFGDQFTAAERDQIVRGVYRHFCTMLMEILHTPRKLHLENWRERIVVVGHEPLMDLLMTGRRPLIILTGHYGNWELAGYLFGMFGFPTVSVARTLDNPFLERYLRAFRERTGQSLIPKTGGFDQMVEVLENKRALSFLADQDAGQRGLYVNFFGRLASTHKAIALLAIEHQAPDRRRGRQAHRAWISLRDPLRRRHRPERSRRLGGRRENSHAEVHVGPGTLDSSRPDPVSLAPSALEASAQESCRERDRACR